MGHFEPYILPLLDSRAQVTATLRCNDLVGDLENAQGVLHSSLSAVLQPASGYCQRGALPNTSIHPLNKGCFGS